MKGICLVVVAVLVTVFSIQMTSAWISFQGMMMSGRPGPPPPPPQTIASVSLSNSTFTNSTANATVGNVSAVMNPASPAFSGNFSITGTNSGQFHLVGAGCANGGTCTLETNSGGTTNGTYNDINIVAAQAGISNSPQQITPNLVGSGGGGSVACVIGPSLPSMPANAKTSVTGFNTCLLNMDPSQAPFNNVNNFLTNCGAANSVSGTPSSWHFSISYFLEASYPACPAGVAIVTDGSLGAALRLTFAVGDRTHGFDYFALGFPHAYDGAYANGFYLPTEYYIKFVLRVPVNTWTQSSAYTNYGEMTVPPNGGGGPDWIDNILQESEMPNSHFSINFYPPVQDKTDTLYNFPGGNYTTYQTIEVLVTSDENSDIWDCLWLNGVAQGCNDIAPATGWNIPQMTKAHDVALTSGAGTFNPPTNDAVTFYKSIQIITCSNVGTGTCPGTMVTTQ